MLLNNQIICYVLCDKKIYLLPFEIRGAIMKIIKYLFIPILILLSSACTSLILKPAYFAWPVEVVGTPDEKGLVSEKRFAFSFNAEALFMEEFGGNIDSSSTELRIIRDVLGFYLITGPAFKNVYVFEGEEGELELENKIKVTEKGLESPAFNQRAPYIELIDGSNKYLLTHKGIEEK